MSETRCTSNRGYVRPQSSCTSSSLNVGGSDPALWPQLRTCPTPDRPVRWLRPRWRASKSWDDRVEHLEQLAQTPGFLSLRDEIISLARLNPSDRALDIGAGTGLLTLAAASRIRHVAALDVSPAMCRYLEAKLASLPTVNVDVLVGNATELPLADGSVDVVLSNYCLHHLHDADKRRALAEACRVLRPDGRIVIGDMMFRIGFDDARDRALIAHFVGTMLRGGPAGVLRLLKNVLRLMTGRGEHPASADWWHRALEDAGFAEVAVRVLDHEGGIAHARWIG
jgi:ubiquinone/menaquinone biosynthesis C-methylase UbiE